MRTAEDVMLGEDKGSPKYMLINLGIHQQLNCFSLIVRSHIIIKR